MTHQRSQGNPLLHPPFFLIPGISPSAPISAQIQQVDQLNTLLLQEIDANFARFHQVITTKILPEIKRFAIGAEPVRETSQFWRSFFEAAAAVRIPIEGDSSHLAPSHQSGYEEDETVTIPPDHSYLSSVHTDGSFMFQPPGAGVTSSTPLPGRHGGNKSWEDSIESPFDRMDRKLREELRIDEGYAESSSMPTPSLPSGYSLPGFAAADASYDVSTGTVEPQDIAASRPRSSGHIENGTPKVKRSESAKWNGLTDLRTTPLNAKFARLKGKQNANKPKQSLVQTIADSLDDSDEEIRMTMSPPVTMNFTLPPRAQAVLNTGRTPMKADSKPAVDKKSAGEARMILDDLLEEMGSMDSPHMPTPEAFGRYSTAPDELGTGRRLFTEESNAQAGPSTAVSAATRKSLANTSYGSDILDQPNDPAPVYADDDSFDEEDSFDSAFGDNGSQARYPNHAVPNEHYGDITGSSAGNDSVFGMPARVVGSTGFNIMQQDEMQTYGGGRLEDAGDEVHHSPTFARRNRR